jgi:hypothetical protein
MILLVKLKTSGHSNLSVNMPLAENTNNPLQLDSRHMHAAAAATPEIGV